MDAPTFYGMFYANGAPKRIALAFSLWAQLAAHPRRLQLSAAPETALWMLAGQNDAGEIALLVANPTRSPVQYVVNGAGGSPFMLLQVSDGNDQVQTLSVNGNRLEIGGETVQLILGAR